MILALMGYMGSGKSLIAKILSAQTGWKVIDLDQEIVQQEGMAIAEIFNSKGELYFRKVERRLLQEILAQPGDFILSLGGGTPAYYDNIDLLKTHTETIFLQVSIPIITERIKRNPEKRPILAKISPEDLPEFIAKHLFERLPYYSQAKYIVNANIPNPNDIAEEILKKTGLR